MQRSSARQAERVFVAEGTTSVQSALVAGAPIEGIYVAPEWRASKAASLVVERAAAAGHRVHELAAGVMEKVADTVTPQPVCAIVGALDVGLEDIVAPLPAQFGASPALSPDGAPSRYATPPVLVCVDVRDPGNLGAVLRSAGASGAGAVVCCSGGVDPYNPKAVRASAGAIFHVPIVVGVTPTETLSALSAAGYRCWATVPAGGTDYLVAELGGPTAFVLGNESKGLDDKTRALLDGALTIATSEPTESLNVAMAATVLCFEMARRRRAGLPVP